MPPTATPSHRCIAISVANPSTVNPICTSISTTEVSPQLRTMLVTMAPTSTPTLQMKLMLMSLYPAPVWFLKLWTLMTMPTLDLKVEITVVLRRRSNAHYVMIVSWTTLCWKFICLNSIASHYSTLVHYLQQYFWTVGSLTTTFDKIMNSCPLLAVNTVRIYF